MLNVALVLLFCISSFVRRCDDVANTYYLGGAPWGDGTEFARLSTVPVATTPQSTSNYWSVAIAFQPTKPVVDNSFANVSVNGNLSTLNQEGLPNNFDGVTTPLPTSLTVNGGGFRSGYKTQTPLSGMFSAGAWALTVRVSISAIPYPSAIITEHTFSLRAKLYKSPNSDGSGAIEISPGVMTSASITFTGASNGIGSAEREFIIQAPSNFPSTRFNNEYLFLMLAMQSVRFREPGGDTVAQYSVNVDAGPNVKLTTPSFTSGYFGASTNGDVCSPFNHHEMYIYISPDSEQYPLDVDGSRVVLNDQGTGTPPFDYVTQRGPFQHGETLVDFHARPRVVQLMINQTYSNRDSYWNGRRGLLRQLSPRKQLVDGAVAQGILRRIISTGEKRDLNCLIVEGPKFEPRHEDAWQEYSYTEALRFQAFDPIYFDPTRRQYTFDKQGSQLVFPATFPITFTTILQDVNIEYIGSWLTYPTFVINGPMSFFNVVNNTTGEKIEIDYDLAVGETITVNLQYGNKQVTKNDGTNLMPYVSNDSDIGTFHLTETNNGINALHVHMVGVSGTSQVVMQWYDKYVGL